MYFTSYFRLFKYMVSFFRYFTVCITYQPPLVFLLALNFICCRYKLTVAKLIAHQMSLQTVRYFLYGLLSACCIEEFVE